MGNVLNQISSSADAGTCNRACAGNAAETCGGPDRLNLYVTKSLAPPTTTPGGGYDANGCKRTEGTFPPGADDPVCEVRGFPVDLDGATTAASLSKCARMCSDDNGCVVYAWSLSQQMCKLFRTGDVWDAVGTPTQGGRDWADLIVEDAGCYTCMRRK